jgi:radical SAM-linked protein
VSQPPEHAAEPRQRWRLVVARDPDAPEATQRDVAAAWVAALDDAHLPLMSAEGTRGRSRVSFAAPLPVGMTAEYELIDVVLTERLPVGQVRDALVDRLPSGWRLIDLFDVWLAGPPLAGRVVAADYRIELADEPDPDGLRQAAADLLAADRIARERQKGGATVTYDLRPLLISVSVVDGSPLVIRTRTRFDQERGTGRPEEVIGALGNRIGTPLAIRRIVRERVLLDEDVSDGRLD